MMLSLLAVSLVWAQDTADALSGCTPRPITGTVSYQTGEQAIDTNANAYGAVSFAERVLLRGSPWGFEMHTISNVARVPTIAECPNGLSYHGTSGLDLSSSASGMMIPILIGESAQLRLFYSGSVSGSSIAFPDDNYFTNRVYHSYGYAASGILYTYAAPLAALSQKEDGLQTRVGDFVAGVSFDLPGAPELGTLTAGYVFSTGLYSNVTSRKLRLFATALLTQRFAVLSLVKGGLDRIPLPSEKGGEFSLFGKRQLLLPPSKVQANPDVGSVDLSTVHLHQEDIGDVFSLRAAVAVRPTPMLHELTARLALPNVLDGDPILESGAIGIKHLVAIGGGYTRLPSLPWYGVEGGGQASFEFSVLDMLYVRRNSVETLTVFPYAQNATEVVVQLTMTPLGDL